jgi:hypothetical protein
VSGQRIRPKTDDDREERMPRIDRDDAESLAGPRAGHAVPGGDRRTDGRGYRRFPSYHFRFLRDVSSLVVRCLLDLCLMILMVVLVS